MDCVEGNIDRAPGVFTAFPFEQSAESVGFAVVIVAEGAKGGVGFVAELMTVITVM